MATVAMAERATVEDEDGLGVGLGDGLGDGAVGSMIGDPLASIGLHGVPSAHSHESGEISP